MEQQQNKVPLILFSGGMDSTYLVQRYLDETDVDTLYVECDPHPLKLKRERWARARLFTLFRKYYQYKVIKDHEHRLVGTYTTHQRLSGVQQISWLTAALAVFDERRHHALAIGYVLGDQAPAFRTQYEAFWRAGWTMTRGVLSPVPPLVFPILDYNETKYDVIDRIDKRLVTSTWVCETPEQVRTGAIMRISAWQAGDDADTKIKACGRCRPCRLLKHTVEDWEDNNNQKYMGEVIRAMNPELYPQRPLIDVHPKGV